MLASELRVCDVKEVLGSLGKPGQYVPDLCGPSLLSETLSEESITQASLRPDVARSLRIVA